MANVAVNSLPAATSVGATDIIPIVQNGVTKKATVKQVAMSGARRQIDSFAGATDDAKHVAAWAAARSAVAVAKITLQYPDRDFGPLTTSIAADFDGMAAIGPDGSEGPKNQEISRGVNTHEVIVATGSGTSSLFVQTGTIKELYFGNISWTGSSSSQWWHNTNPSSASIYPGEIHSCAWDSFGQGVLGNSANKFTITQFVFSGHCTILNFSNEPVHIGGSDDMNLWGAGYLNIQSPASVSGGGTKIIFHVDYLEKSAISNVYVTNDAGWVGVRVDGPVLRGCKFYNVTVEGKAAGSPATAACVDVRGGHTIWFGLDIGQVTTANGAFLQSAGIVDTYSTHYRQADTGNATNDANFFFLYHTGGISRHKWAVNANGNPLRFRWASAGASPTGVQNQDFAYPTANEVE